jgi:hypothetical protein
MLKVKVKPNVFSWTRDKIPFQQATTRTSMSRLTSTEVIDSGNYLEDDFDPTTLTVPHLNAILNYHDIPRPPQSNKGKLVQAFRDDIYPRRKEFIQERKTMEMSEASAIGIHDGHTGAHLGSPEVGTSLGDKLLAKA